MKHFAQERKFESHQNTARIRNTLPRVSLQNYNFYCSKLSNSSLFSTSHSGILRSLVANRDGSGDIKAVITAHANAKTDWKINTDKLPNELNNTLLISPIKMPNGPRTTVNHVLTNISSTGYVCCVAIS